MIIANSGTQFVNPICIQYETINTMTTLHTHITARQDEQLVVYGSLPFGISYKKSLRILRIRMLELPGLEECLQIYVGIAICTVERRDVILISLYQASIILPIPSVQAKECLSVDRMNMTGQDHSYILIKNFLCNPHLLFWISISGIHKKISQY